MWTKVGFASVLVCKGCCNKLAEMFLLKTNLFSHNSGNQKPEFKVGSRVTVPLKVIAEKPCLSLLLLVASGIPWLIDVSLQLLPPSL